MPANTNRIPPTCSMVSFSCSTIIEVIIATGNSVALKIDARPPPTLGMEIVNNKIGNMIPKNPRVNPK